MLRTIIIAALAACGVSSPPTPATADPPVEQPDGHNEELIKPKDNVYFCCVSVDGDSKSGEGCQTIGEKQLDGCANFLICADGAYKKDGVVTCF